MLKQSTFRETHRRPRADNEVIEYFPIHQREHPAGVGLWLINQFAILARIRFSCAARKAKIAYTIAPYRIFAIFTASIYSGSRREFFKATSIASLARLLWREI